jgi:hypothetical protein
MQSAIFSDGPTALVASNFLMAIPFFWAAIGLRAAITNRHYGWILLFIFLLILAAIINNPIIHARFKLAGLGFFFIDYIFRGKKIRLLVFLIIIGVATAPLFNIFRTKDHTVTRVQKDKSEFGDYFLSYDYDAFQLACYTILTVDKEGITYGANLAGVMLGFIPRAWWEGKPNRTSFIIYKTMIKYRHVGTNNLSTPIMAEGFFAFSWAGAIIIGLLYWAAVSKIVVLSRKNSDSLIFLLRSIFTGLVLIFLRGTLIVAIPVVIGSFLAALIPWLIFQRKNRSVISNAATCLHSNNNLKCPPLS